MKTHDRARSNLDAVFVALVTVAAVLLVAVSVEGASILLDLRAAEEGLQAAAAAAALQVDTVSENGYAVQRLREADGPNGPSALTAAQLQLDARGLGARTEVETILLVDDVVVLNGTCHHPALLGRVIGLETYDFSLTVLAELSP